MRQCKISKKIKNGYETQPLPGVFVFRGWSQRGELVTRTASGEISGEGCIDPVAIIEDADGKIHVVDADRMVFLEGEGTEVPGAVTHAMKNAAMDEAIYCGVLASSDRHMMWDEIANIIGAAFDARESN